jgi:hypothetical protein
VPRVCEQREAPGYEAADDLGHRERGGQDERDCKRAPVGTTPVVVVVIPV